MFEAGMDVAWSHDVGPQHTEASVLRRGALPPGTPIGCLVEPANEPRTWWTVRFPDGERVLTTDELVLVGPEEE